jgi:hypothetical protein
MTDINPSPASDAAAAFDDLRQEVKLLRKAVAAWVDEQHEPPDYSATLAKLTEDSARTAKSVVWLVQRPAMALTPAELAKSIEAAGESARKADHGLIVEARNGLNSARDAFSGWTAQARTADLQKRRLLQVAALAGAASFAFGLGLPLKVIQAAPQGWGWRERAAALVIDADRWEAGQHLLKSADPDRYGEQQADIFLGQKSRDASNHKEAEHSHDVRQEHRPSQASTSEREGPP